MPSHHPTDRLVLSYLGEDVYHRSLPEDQFRPLCSPTRIQGVPMMRVRAARIGLGPCPRCWPPDVTGETADPG